MSAAFIYSQRTAVEGNIVTSSMLTLLRSTVLCGVACNQLKRGQRNCSAVKTSPTVPKLMETDVWFVDNVDTALGSASGKYDKGTERLYFSSPSRRVRRFPDFQPVSDRDPSFLLDIVQRLTQ